MNPSQTQPKHRTQDRNNVPTTRKRVPAPTDRGSQDQRARGTKFTGQTQPEHRKVNNRNKNY